MWVVYDHPRDFPDDIVVREHWVAASDTADTELGVATQARIFHDLTTARQWLAEQGLTNIGRYENDDPVISEVWV